MLLDFACTVQRLITCFHHVRQGDVESELELYLNKYYSNYDHNKKNTA